MRNVGSVSYEGFETDPNELEALELLVSAFVETGQLVDREGHPRTDIEINWPAIVLGGLEVFHVAKALRELDESRGGELTEDERQRAESVWSAVERAIAQELHYGGRLDDQVEVPPHLRTFTRNGFSFEAFNAARSQRFRGNDIRSWSGSIGRSSRRTPPTKPNTNQIS